MQVRINRFVLPLLFTVAGILLTVRAVTELSTAVSLRAPLYNLIPGVAGSTISDARLLLMVVLPVYIIEFVILTLPVALIMLIVNKLVRALTYDQSVMRLGKKFGGYRMIKRAVMPAMFALSFGDLVLSLINNWPFEASLPTPVPTGFGLMVFYPLLSLLSSLVVLPFSLAFFMPTWVLEDSGIVSHLKSGQLENRRCPYTEGVGRWYSSFISGFAIVAFLFMMAYRYFYRPFFLDGEDLTPGSIGFSVFVVFGLPLLIMSFVVPVIMFSETSLKWTTRRVQGMARRLGARDVELEQIVPVQSQQTSQPDHATP